MARIPWRRTLHLLLQHQQRSLLPLLSATSRSSSAAPFSEELCSWTASRALSTREAHFSSQGYLSGCTQVCGSKITDDWGIANGRRSFHATGVQHMAQQNFDETSGLENAKEIKSAYDQLAKQWFSDTIKVHIDAGKKMQEIQRAYEVLTDDEKRAVHDKLEEVRLVDVDVLTTPTILQSSTR